jgi:hypothetical protein
MRRVLEWRLINPNTQTCPSSPPNGSTLLNNHRRTQDHVACRFGPYDLADVDVVLDLSCVQFDEPRRGLGGSGLFIEMIGEYYERMKKSTERTEVGFTKQMHRIDLAWDDRWLGIVAYRAITR